MIAMKFARELAIGLSFLPQTARRDAVLQLCLASCWPAQGFTISHQNQQTLGRLLAIRAVGRHLKNPSFSQFRE
jgi:hypothetical protein